MYSAANTFTDSFKFRNKFGLDLALEALKNAWRSRMVRMADLSHFAKVNRVNRVKRVMHSCLKAATQ